MEKKDPRQIVEEWNRRYPVGQLVEVNRIIGKVERTQTAGRALLSAAGTPIVKCAELGWYILNRVKAVEVRRD